MRPIQKSNKLDDVCYEIRGPALQIARQMEEDGHKIIKLNIGNLAVFGFDAPEEIQQDMRADFDLPRGDRRNEFLRARLNDAGGLDLFPNQSSGVLTSTVWGDGLIDNPPDRSIARGDTVQFIPFASLLA